VATRAGVDDGRNQLPLCFGWHIRNRRLARDDAMDWNPDVFWLCGFSCSRIDNLEAMRRAASEDGKNLVVGFLPHEPIHVLIVLF